MDTVFSACKEEDGFGEDGQEERSHKSPRDGAGERYVVEVLDARERGVVYYIVCSLEIEGFLDLGIWGYEEMEDYDGWEDEVEKEVWR